MEKIKVFISSVQAEFADERQMLFDYLMQDALLGLFFEPFVFEKLPAMEQSAENTYLNEVQRCDIYLGLFGKDYGFEDSKGSSPTEHEYNLAKKLNKYRLIYISNHKNSERHPKEIALIQKAEKEIIRKKFSNKIELKADVYSSLISFLEEKEFIRTVPFDASINKEATFDDIDTYKVVNWVNAARAKRSFPLEAHLPVKDIFTHLNLIKNDKLTNAALLLFANEPQRFFRSSEVKCVQFNAYKIEKPIPAYQVYKGDVFMLVNQAVDFVLSRINVSTGTRSSSNQVDVEYEIPRTVVSEAIVNAIAHRDYTSKGSVQVMLFKDRLEIWNPGTLPSNLTIEDLKKPHSSFPHNLLLAEPMYLAGYIERIGTGTTDMLDECNERGLKELEFVQDDVFKTTIWRNNATIGKVSEEPAGELSGEVTVELGEELKEEVKRVVTVLTKPMKRSEIQKILQLKHDDYFRLNYINPTLEKQFIELLYPDSPNHPKQKYKLTDKGKALQILLKRKSNNG
jgi:predicted HTH transcriptional regulator